jgi:hypothetical protein
VCARGSIAAGPHCQLNIVDEANFLISGVQYRAIDETMVDALARAYSVHERPRCMCVDGGVEMYIAKHRSFVIKRMPGTGPEHHPSCDSFEDDASRSGRGALFGGAIVPAADDFVDLRVDFPLTRAAGRTSPAMPERVTADVTLTPRPMSMQALLQFLFEQAGFNRWSPAMAGRRHQGVIQRYLYEAASDLRLKGKVLASRLYVPEAFDEITKEQISARRRERLSILTPKVGGGYDMALVIGEFKDVIDSSGSMRIRIRHMADAPLIMNAQDWRRVQRKFSWMFDLKASEVGGQVRIVMCLLIYAKQEHVLHVDTATCMLTSRNWIPLEAAFEVDLVRKLTEEKRCFLKPLRYDASASEAFPNFLLLDTGRAPTPLHVLSGFMSKAAFAAKEKAIACSEPTPWVWQTTESMAPLPPFVAKPNAFQKTAEKSVS